MEPNGSPKCPGDSVTLYCNHTKTTHNPGWRVRGNGLPQFGFAQFGVEPLVGHSLEQSDLVEEILTIATVQPKFDGFTYTCLYSIIEGNVISDPAVVLQVISMYIYYLYRLNNMYISMSIYTVALDNTNCTYISKDS